MKTITEDLFEGGQQTLDDWPFTKVVFQGTRVPYHGRPTLLRQVWFYNVDFEGFENTGNGRKIIQRLLDSDQSKIEKLDLRSTVKKTAPEPQ